MEKGTTNNPNGRPRGSLNKKTQELFDKAEELGVNPFEVLLLFAKGDFAALGYDKYQFKQVGEHAIEELTISPETRLRAAEKACEYLYPKRRAVEFEGDKEGGGIVFKLAYPDK
jgi:hypothetical protein